MIDGYSHSYRVLFPARALDPTAPRPRFVVFAFHGSYSSGDGFTRTAGWDKAAALYDAVIILPTDDYENMRSSSRHAVPQIRDRVFEELNLDPATKIGVTGFSAGGQVGLQLACQVDSFITAAAPVSPVPAIFSARQANTCARAGIFPVLFVVDEKDMILDEGEEFLAREMPGWVSRNLCAGARRSWSPFGDESVASGPQCGPHLCYEYEGCRERVSVCSVESPSIGTSGLGVEDSATLVHHYWNRAENGFDTTRAVMNFMRTHLEH